MKINGEEVERVTSFDQLRTGMIVWIKPCSICGGQRRAMLLSKELFAIRRGSGFVNETAWAPAPLCHDKACIAKSSVENKIIYRVVDPLLNAQTVTSKREAVRP